MKKSEVEAGRASSRIIEEIRAPAEREAARHFGSGPAAPWQQPTPRGPAFRWAIGGLVCVLIALLGSGAWILMHGCAAVPAPASHPISLATSVSEASATLAVPVVDATAQRVKTVAALRVERTSGVWRIHAVAASRYEALRELAKLSGTALPVGADALRIARPLDLRWEGRNLASAWQAVIGDEASYALQCRSDRCTAWIVDPNPTLKASTVATSGDAVSTSVATARPARATPEPSEPSAYD